MFGFGYALVPFYEKICQVTGLRDIDRAEDALQEALIEIWDEDNGFISIFTGGQADIVLIAENTDESSKLPR